MKKTLAILEQISVAAGSFIFFILVSRMAGAESFGEFTKIFISSQIIYSISAQWIVVPITSTRINTEELNLYSSSLTRLFTYAGFIPIIAIIFFYLFSSKIEFFLFILSVTLLSIGLIFFELLRYFNIRINKVPQQLKLNILRWFISIAFVFFLSKNINNFVFIITFSYLIGLSPIFYKQLLLALEIRPTIFISKIETIDNYTEHSKTMASLGLSTAFFTVITTMLMSRISVSALGAVQAFRSIVNWAPLLVQHIETHFSAERLNKKDYSFLNSYWYGFFMLFFISTTIFFYFYDEWIIFTVLGSSYIEYSSALIIVFILVMVQSATRILGAQARLHNLQHIYKKQVYILLLSSLFFGLLYFILEIKTGINLLLMLMTLVAIVQAITMFYFLNNRKKL